MLNGVGMRAIVLNGICAECRNDVQNAEFRSAECHFDECHYTECRYAECHFA
jgi:hypothetical protein